MKKHQFIFLPAIFALTNLPLDNIIIQTLSKYVPEDARLNFTQLAKKYNCTAEEFEVETEDGYILTLFHMPGDTRKAVLLLHGVLDSADTFILRGNTSLAVTLYREGYDVWIGNLRGSRYARRHVQLSPDFDKEYWNFYVHEFGVFDAPAILDFITERGVDKISAIGHSQGNMVFYVLGCEKPEYNDRINVMIALGPVCYLNANNFKSPIRKLVEAGPLLTKLLHSLNLEEVFGEETYLTYFRDYICTLKGLGYKLCAEGIFLELGGNDIEEFEPDFFYSVIGHYPTSSSRKNVEHLLQIAERKKFAKYDFGPVRNLDVYGRKKPPNYDLSKVTMKIALIVGRNDNVTPIKNVNLLRKQLPNVVSYNLVDQHPKLNHIDHVWGRNMHKYLLPDVLKLLSKYNT